MAAVSALIKRIWDRYTIENVENTSSRPLCVFVRLVRLSFVLRSSGPHCQRCHERTRHLHLGFCYGWSLIPCEARKTVATQDVIQVHLFDHGLVIWNGDVRIYDKGQHIFSKSLATSWTWRKIKSIPACCTVWGMNIQGMEWSDQAVDFSIFLGVESEISQGWVRDDHFLTECIQLPHIHLISCILF